jgi:nucleoside-diphosphate-sugar epimerase
MTRILVTGASGFIGQELVSRLAKQGYRGVATGRQPPVSLPQGWTGCRREAVLSDHRGDWGIDAVIHLEVKHHIAATSSLIGREMTAVNVGGTRAWLDWAGRLRIPKFILASSVKAVKAMPGENTEDVTFPPTDPYGQSKAIAEDAVRLWADEDRSRTAVILRLAPVYGPGNTANLADFTRQVLRRRPCYIGAGQTRKSIVSRRNAVEAFVWCLQTAKPGLDIFNVADPQALPIRDLAKMIAKSAGVSPPQGIPIPLARVTALAGDVAEYFLRRPVVFDSRRFAALMEQSVFSVDKLRGAGFVHPQTTEDGIHELVDWLMRKDADCTAGDLTRAAKVTGE